MQGDGLRAGLLDEDRVRGVGLERAVEGTLRHTERSVRAARDSACVLHRIRQGIVDDTRGDPEGQCLIGIDEAAGEYDDCSVIALRHGDELWAFTTGALPPAVIVGQGETRSIAD